MQVEIDRKYNVRLARVVTIGPFKYKPLSEIEMTGALLLQIIEQEGEEAIDVAKPI